MEITVPTLNEPLTQFEDKNDSHSEYLTVNTAVITNHIISNLPAFTSNSLRIQEDPQKNVISIRRIVSCSLIIDRAVFINMSQLSDVWKSTTKCTSSWGEVKIWLDTINIAEIDKERKQLGSIKRNILTIFHHGQFEFLGGNFTNIASLLLQYIGISGGAWISWVVGLICLFRVFYNRKNYKEFLTQLQNNFKTLTANSANNETFSRTTKEQVVANYQLSIVQGRVVDFVEDCDFNATSTVRLGDTTPYLIAISSLDINTLISEDGYSKKVHSFAYFFVIIVFILLLIIPSII